MFNDEGEYAATRLGNSVVRLKTYEEGGVFFVTKVLLNGGSRSFSKAELLGYNSQHEEAKIPTNRMEFSFGPLGYLTHEERGLLYVARVPLRRDYKQGIRSNQLVTVKPDKKGHRAYLPQPKEGEVGTRAFMSALAACAHEKYLGLSACIERVEEVGYGFGLSKHFAISNSYLLEYRGEVVGRLLDNGLLKLNTEFNFLEQELAAEVGNECLAK